MAVTIESTMYGTTLSAVECGTCGIPFGLPTSFRDSRQTDGRKFYCPNGCHINYGTHTEIDRLKKQLDYAHTQAARVREDLAAERKSHASTKGKVTKLRNRAQHGVCAVCSRTFQNVARHMASKHGE